MFSGVERLESFAKVHNISMNENCIFLNHVAKKFQLTQIVYERFMLNILFLQKHRKFRDVPEFHD
ncbi:hypothetical protein Hanom_Chr11g01011411 [Helianthus anomalus]